MISDGVRCSLVIPDRYITSMATKHDQAQQTDDDLKSGAIQGAGQCVSLCELLIDVFFFGITIFPSTAIVTVFLSMVMSVFVNPFRATFSLSHLN